MADVTKSMALRAHSYLRILLAAISVLASGFAWSDLRLNYVTIPKAAREPIERSNQYELRYLGSSIGSTMARKRTARRSPIAAFFRDGRTQGSLQIEYTLVKETEEPRRSIGIYEKYATDERSFLRPWTSVSQEHLSIVKARFQAGHLSSDDELFLTVTLASYSSEIALGIDNFIKDAGLNNLAGDHAEVKLAIASTAIAAFSHNSSTVSVKTVGLPERELRNTSHVVFYLAEDGFDAADLTRGSDTTGQELLRTGFGDGWYGNIVFRVDREVLPCERNSREESINRCLAVTNFMDEWMRHGTGDVHPQGDRSFGWRVVGREEVVGDLQQFLDDFDLSRAIGNYSGQSDGAWSAKGALWVENQGSAKGELCLKDIEVYFTFGSSELPYVITRADIAVGEFEMASGRRPSSQYSEHQCAD